MTDTLLARVNARTWLYFPTPLPEPRAYIVFPAKLNPTREDVLEYISKSKF